MKDLVTERKTQFIFKHIINAQNMPKLKKRLSASQWDNEHNNLPDPQEAFTHFHKQIGVLYNSRFLLIKIKLGYKNRKPWLTTGIKQSIRVKNKLHIKYMKVPTAQIKQNYLNYKSKLNYITRELERDHIVSVLNEYRSNLSKSWGIMEDIINRN